MKRSYPALGKEGKKLMNKKPAALSTGQTGFETEYESKSNKDLIDCKETCIPVDGNYAIGADQYSWQILKRITRKRNGVSVEEWEAIKWYSTLENAITGFADFKLRASDAKALADLFKEQKKLKAGLCQSLHTQFKGVA